MKNRHTTDSIAFQREWGRKLLLFCLQVFFLPGLLHAQRVVMPAAKQRAPQFLYSVQAQNKAEVVITRITGNYITRNTPSKLEIFWRDSTRTCRLYFSTRPGSSPDEYDQAIGDPGKGRLTISSGFEVLPVGIYYSILKDTSDPQATSVPFIIYVQPEVPVNMVAPANGALVEGGNPEFRWDPIAGMPYYLIVLSQGALTIVNNEETGEFESLSGVNIIWQAFASQGGIRYGDSDLSATWPDSNIPPLLPGVEYNWLVFSAFAPDLRYVAWDLYPLSTSSFQVSRPALTRSPVLLFPTESSLVDEDELTFLWTSVPSATRYHVQLHERLAQSDIGDGTILLWHHITVDTSALFRAREFLARKDYVVRIVAESPAALSASPESSFQYGAQTFFAQNYVRDRMTRAGVPNARLDFTGDGGTGLPFSLFTDEFSWLQITLPLRTYEVRATAPGYVHEKQVLFPYADTTLFVVEMEQAENVLSGRVVDPEKRPIPFARVLSSGGDERRTDGAGYFNLPVRQIPDKVSFSALGYQKDDYQAFVPNDWGVVDLGDVVLAPVSSSLRITSVDADGLPLSGVRLNMARAGEETIRLTSGASGTAEFPLARGTWQITPSYPGYYPSPEEYFVRLEEGQSPEVTFVFFRAALFEGRVLFRDELVAGASIELISKSGVKRSAVSDNYGTFQLDAPAGDHAVRVYHERFGSWSAEVTLREGRVTRFDVPLSPATIIWGHVSSGEDGTPLSGAMIYDRSSNQKLAESDALGLYAFTAEIDRSYQLEAELQGFASRGTTPATAVPEDSLRVDFILDPSTAVLRGRVLGRNGPVAGARVTLLENGSSVTTDLLGQYEMPVQPGTWQVQAEANCLTSDVEQVVVAPGAVVTLDLQLSGESAIVSGRVTDKSGNALDGANLFAVGEKNFTAESDSSGRYTLCLDPGAYYILVSRIGYLSADTTLLLNAGENLTEVDFRLEENFASVAGTAADEDGKPVADLQVILTNAWQNRMTTTGPDGTFRFDGIYPGQALLLIRSQFYFASPLSLNLQGGEVARPQLVLQRNDGVISGVVVDGYTGEGIDSAFVAAREYSSGTIFTAASAGAEGRFRIENLPVRDRLFRLFASKEGYVLSQAVDSVAANSTGITLSLLARNASLAGTVVDAGSGEPLSGVVVRVTRPGEPLRQTTTSETGQFVIPGLVFTFDYQVTLKHELFYADTFTVRVPSAGVRLPLQRRLGFLAGTILQKDGDVPVSDALVVMTNVDGRGRSDSTRSDAQGNYVAGVWPGRYRVSVSAPFFYATPNQQLLEITPEDTTQAEVFLLEKQTLASLKISGPARVFAPDGAVAFTATARDSAGRIISEIPGLRWHAVPAADTVLISPQGMLTVAPRYLGPITVSVEDSLSRSRAEMMTMAYARIDSGTSAVYFSRAGLMLDFVPGTVPVPVELSFETTALTPVQRVENEFQLLAPLHRIIPDNLSFDRPAQLSLRIPDRQGSNSAGRYAVLRWNSIFSAWDAEELEALSQEAAPGDRLTRAISATGDYALAQLSGPLAVRELSIQPNPFSPHQSNRFGETGTAIRFDITTNQAALPLVTAKIYNLEGELVIILANQEPFPKGVQHISWDGRGRDGRLLRNGRYLLHFLVDDGTSVQEQIRSIVLIQ